VSYITSIGTAVPKHKFDQSTISTFMENLAIEDEQQRKIKTIFRASAIQTRYSVLED
jgi:predicted naringenin-chalcone synthase